MAGEGGEVPAVRRIPAASLLAAVSHVQTAEAVLEGRSPREAFAAAAEMFFSDLLPGLMYAARVADPAEYAQSAALPASATWPGDAREPSSRRRWTTRCFALSAAQHRDVLRGEVWGLPPLVELTVDAAARLAWLEEMLRRYATGGGSLAQCARGAYDEHLGRPRRKRAPVEARWLATQVTEALDGAWEALHPFTGPPGRGLPAARPRLSGATMAGIATQASERLDDAWRRMVLPVAAMPALGWHARTMGRGPDAEDGKR